MTPYILIYLNLIKICKIALLLNYIQCNMSTYIWLCIRIWNLKVPRRQNYQQTTSGWTWWGMLVTAALVGPRQEDCHELEASLG